MAAITPPGPNLVKPKQTQLADSNKIGMKDTYKSKPCWNQAVLANICCLSAVYREDGKFMANQGKLSLHVFLFTTFEKKKMHRKETLIE